ncbi:MAG: CapA family protein [Vallitalea sp.]|jgi:poly-gamma-glutamate synthesis protein (capsule biosynthesis protein)|nr:CapA family protein [Vallitalea sp.]
MKLKKISVILIIVLLLNGCTDNSYILTPNYDSIETLSSINVINNISEKLVEHEINEVSITAVGDIMFHKWQLQRAYDEHNDSFDFLPSFTYVRDFLSESDFTVGNLETTLAGRHKGRNYRMDNAFQGYHGYPCFNTPEILAKNLKDIGFDLVSTCNNHSLDSKSAGVKSTLDRLDEQGISHVGTYRNEEEASEILIKNINDINFAFVSYTYGTNGYVIPEDEPYLINTLETYDENRKSNIYDENKINEMIEDVKKADETKADMVVVIIHFGNEYFDFPNSHQRKIVDRLFDAGADIILGSHPHVLQPIEIRDIEDEDGTIRKGVVIYSLGNFISSQRYSKERPVNTDIGAIMDINIRKIDNHKPEIVSLSLIPTCVYRNNTELGVLPVDKILDNMDKLDIEFDKYDYTMNRLQYTKNKTIKHLLSYVDTPYEYKNYKYTISIKDK